MKTYKAIASLDADGKNFIIDRLTADQLKDLTKVAFLIIVDTTAVNNHSYNIFLNGVWLTADNEPFIKHFFSISFPEVSENGI